MSPPESVPQAALTETISLTIKNIQSQVIFLNWSIEIGIKSNKQNKKLTKDQDIEYFDYKNKKL